MFSGIAQAHHVPFLLPGLLILLQLTQHSFASGEIIVYGSVLVSNTGEHTPLAQELEDATMLTSLGAWQMYHAGSFFRKRYMPTVVNASIPIISDLYGLSLASVDADQIYVLAADSQYAIASAQAFMQGLYPPLSISQATEAYLNPTSLLANDSYLDSPLSGYQYAWIKSASANDPASIYTNGALHCPAWTAAANSYLATSAFNAMQSSSQLLYKTVGAGLADTILPVRSYTYGNAYKIWDYLSYLYTHNATVYTLLATGQLAEDNAYHRLRDLSSDLLWAQYGGSATSITSIAGRTLAAQILAQLSTNVRTEGANAKLSLIVTTAAPLISLFSVLQLPADSSAFTKTPQWGDTLTFELFAYSNTSASSSTSAYPDFADLYIRFLYLNNTASTDQLTDHSLFSTTESTTESIMSWQAFDDLMLLHEMSGVGTWCNACDAWDTSVFCLAYNTSATANDPPSATPSASCTLTPTASGGVSTKAVGVIGAVVALAGAGVLLIFAVGLGGLRFTRTGDGTAANTVGAGGFKGQGKMMGDADVEDLKGPAVGIGANVGWIGKERVGSWELRDARVRELERERQGWRDKELESGVSPGRSVRGRSTREDDGDEFKEAVKPFEAV